MPTTDAIRAHSTQRPRVALAISLGLFAMLLSVAGAAWGDRSGETSAAGIPVTHVSEAP